MSSPSVRDLARIVLPSRGERGRLLMLECYIDDTGTDTNSLVVGWGGVLGTPEDFTELNKRWSALLTAPCDGKPPITKYSSADCRSGKGEFFGYSQGERDLTRRNFRQALIESNLVWHGCVVEKSMYEAVVSGYAKKLFSSHNFFTLNNCICRFLSSCFPFRDNDLAIIVDDGAMHPEMSKEIEKAGIGEFNSAKIFSLTYAKVSALAGLQAADIIATELNWAYQQHLSGKPLDPHFEALLSDETQTGALLWPTREYMEQLVNILNTRPGSPAVISPFSGRPIPRGPVY